jgi:adenylate cyclase
VPRKLPAQEGVEQRPFTLLVVDDEETNRDLLAQRLSRRGYRIIEAANGRQALEAV